MSARIDAFLIIPIWCSWPPNKFTFAFLRYWSLQKSIVQDAALKLGVLASEEFDNLVVLEKMIGPSHWQAYKDWSHCPWDKSLFENQLHQALFLNHTIWLDWEMIFQSNNDNLDFQSDDILEARASPNLQTDNVSQLTNPSKEKIYLSCIMLLIYRM